MDGPQNPTPLAVFKDWLPVLTVVGGALWGLYTYIDHQKAAAIEAQLHQEEAAVQARAQADKDSATRRIEAQKPFLQKQLDLYYETVQVAGKLATLKPDEAEWQSAKQRFYMLFWSELALVESGRVAAAMVHFREVLNGYEPKPAEAGSANDLRNASISLSHAIRDDIKDLWNAGGASAQSAITAR